MKKHNQIQKINIVFLITVLVSTFGAFFDFSAIVSSYMGLMIVSQVLIVLPAAVYLIKEKVSYKEAVCFKSIKVSNVLLLALFSILITPVLTLINALSMLFAVNNTTDTMSRVMEGQSFLLSLAVIAVLPCIFEESVYRGVFYNEYRKTNPLKGMLLSALLFGLMHMNFNQFSYAFFMGIIFALVIEATDSILSAMIIHFIINGFSVMLLHFMPKLVMFLETTYRSAQDSEDMDTMRMIESTMGGTDFSIEKMFAENEAVINSMTLLDVLSMYGMRALICGALAFVVFRMIAKNAGRLEHIKGLFCKKEIGEAEEKLVTLPLILAIAVCVATMVMYELNKQGVI